MTKASPNNSDSPFQRFAKLAKALAAVSKKELDEKASEWKRKREKQKAMPR
jgi:hypothetical protein